MPLSSSELLVVVGIIFLMAFECYLALKSRSWVEIYRPTLFVAVVLAFYVLVGPLRAILAAGEIPNFAETSGTLYRGVEHRSFLFWGWLGGFVFYASLLLGFHFKPPVKYYRHSIIKTSLTSVKIWGQLLCFVGLLLYAIVNGGRMVSLLNPFSPYALSENFFGLNGIDVGPLKNYFLLAINLLIPGILIQFTVWLRHRRGLWIVALWCSIASLIFLSETFRYRILLLIIPMALLWLFYYKRRPKIVLLLLFMVGFIGINGIIGLSRTHLRGIDLTRVNNYTPVQVFTSSFEETGVFLTTSALFNVVPSELPHVGLEPLKTALLQPIPRDIFPQKPDGQYSNYVREIIYKTPFSYTAYLNYGEYYLIGGWGALVLISFLLGWLLRRLWHWFLCRQYEPLAQVVYLSNSCYLYVVVSRGYLPQVVMLYVFTVLPVFLVYWCTSKQA